MAKKAEKAVPARPITSDNRKLQPQAYKTLRLSKRIKHTGPALPPAWQMLKETLVQMRNNKRLFAAILGVFAVLYVIFVRGFAGSDLSVIKEAFTGEAASSTNQVATGFGLFVYLIGNASSAQSEVASLYQFAFICIGSLALIWTFRQLQSNAKTKVTMRRAYYLGTAPLVPYVLVIVVILAQLLPALIGTTLYQQVSSAGLAASSIEMGAWLILLLATLLLSLYMLCSSVFALYIVTLPDMTPLVALRSARELVKHRRLVVARKILFAPLVLSLAAAVLFIPLLVLATGLAEVFFFLYGVLCLAVINGYMYRLYRSLI